MTNKIEHSDQCVETNILDPCAKGEQAGDPTEREAGKA